MVVVTIITGTAHAGKRNEVLSHLAKVAEYAKEHHIALLTFSSDLHVSDVDVNRSEGDVKVNVSVSEKDNGDTLVNDSTVLYERNQLYTASLNAHMNSTEYWTFTSAIKTLFLQRDQEQVQEQDRDQDADQDIQDKAKADTAAPISGSIHPSIIIIMVIRKVEEEYKQQWQCEERAERYDFPCNLK
jgi:quinol monooxygenase YgiN